MKTQNDLWSLFRLSDRKQFDRVPLQVIEYLHKLLPATEHKGWMFWREPLTEWQELARLPVLLRQEVAPPQVPVPPRAPGADGVKSKSMMPPMTATHTEIEDFSSRDIQSKIRRPEPASRLQPAASVPQPKVLSMTTGEQSVSLMLESKLASEDRSRARYNKRFKIRIVLPDGRVFESVTEDASLSGLRLRDLLPDGLPRFFNVEFDCGDEGKIQLMCSVINERGGRPAHRLRIQVNDYQNKMRTALMRAA